MKKIFILVLSCSFLFAGCQTSPEKRTKIGAGVGAAAGAGLGAIIGNKSGKSGEGALIGAAVGGLLGGSVGNYLDKQAKELAEVAETRRTDQGIITKLKGDILFDTGKAYLKPEAAKKVKKIGEIISKYPEDRLTVIGHTDSQGSNELNARLSNKRAEAVYQKLVKAGVPSQNIEVQGMGEMRPVASNATEYGRAQNRRVEIEIRIDKEAFKKKKKS